MKFLPQKVKKNVLCNPTDSFVSIVMIFEKVFWILKEDHQNCFQFHLFISFTFVFSFSHEILQNKLTRKQEIWSFEFCKNSFPWFDDLKHDILQNLFESILLNRMSNDALWCLINFNEIDCKKKLTLKIWIDER